MNVIAGTAAAIGAMVASAAMISRRLFKPKRVSVSEKRYYVIGQYNFDRLKKTLPLQDTMIDYLGPKKQIRRITIKGRQLRVKYTHKNDSVLIHKMVDLEYVCGLKRHLDKYVVLLSDGNLV